MEALWKQGRTEWQLSAHGFSFAEIWMFAIAAWWHLPSWSGVPCFLNFHLQDRFLSWEGEISLD